MIHSIQFQLCPSWRNLLTDFQRWLGRKCKTDWARGECREGKVLVLIKQESKMRKEGWKLYLSMFVIHSEPSSTERPAGLDCIGCSVPFCLRICSAVGPGACSCWIGQRPGAAGARHSSERAAQFCLANGQPSARRRSQQDWGRRNGRVTNWC